MSVLAYITDLFFQVKVKETARQVGVPVKLTTSWAEFTAELENRPSLVIVDLASKGIDSPALITQVKSSAPDVPVVAFAAHVNKDQIQLASGAGADYSMPRSKFSQQLPMILTSLTKH